MQKTFLDKHGNIYTPTGDSFTIKIGLITDVEFSENDKCLIEINSPDNKENYYKKIVDINTSDEKPSVFFRMENQDAKKIQAGKYSWSFSVFINANKTGTGELIGDEKITPMNGSRDYRVVDGTQWKDIQVKN